MPQTHWVIYDDGSTGRIELSTSDGPPVLTKAGRFVTEAAYTERLGHMHAAREARLAAEQAAQEADAHDDYNALVASGIPDATARRLSGYQADAGEAAG